jgi:regulator of sigma E protease
MLTTLLAFAIVLGPVIVFHEFGHFIVAKLSGIYVKTFSVGFGPKLLKFRWGETQYALSAIPMGGYVKMAGDSVSEERRAVEGAADREAHEAGEEAEPPAAAARGGEELLYTAGDDVPDEEIPAHRDFRNKPLLTRLAVVTAGPIANFVLALVVLTGVLYHEGMRVPPTTTLDEIEADSDEWQAGLRGGDEVLAVAGTPVEHALELVEALAAQGDEPFDLRLRRDGQEMTLTLPRVRRDEHGVAFPLLATRLDSRIGLVKKDGPAWNAGLRSGDRIVEIDSQPVHFYDELADLINPSIGVSLHLVWERDGRRHQATVVPEGEEVPVGGSLTETRRIGRIQIEPFQLVVPVSLARASREGLLRSWFFARDTARFLGKLVTGEGSRDALGGPIRIGQVAGSALRWGPSMLLYFMAFFSVNLFLLNLLPIPVLDGGHVMFLLIEAVRGQALSLRTQERLLKIGVSALIALMGYVVVNDIVRVFAQ